LVPFLVEDELLGLGATFSKVKDWGVHTVKDGQLITGQNPASRSRLVKKAGRAERFLGHRARAGCRDKPLEA
jgi:hypothetical protein